MLIIWRELGLTNYLLILEKMRRFVANANAQTAEEIWLLQHHAVFTLGQTGKYEHILNAGNIPIIETERGGQVTYHGPGQLVIYFMLNLKKRNLGPRELVSLLENTVIKLLKNKGIIACTKNGAPGIYVEDKKIASLGLRIRRGWSFHGLALNVDMNLEPFSRINPCGFKGLVMTQIKDFLPHIKFEQVSYKLKNILQQSLT